MLKYRNHSHVLGLAEMMNFPGVIAGDSDIMDKLDADQALDEYAEMVGAPPSVVVPDDKVKVVREGRAKQVQQQQMAEQAPALATAANGFTSKEMTQYGDGQSPLGRLEWPALLRKLDRMDPSYRS